jgi:hypothetical protein
LDIVERVFWEEVVGYEGLVREAFMLLRRGGGSI